MILHYFKAKDSTDLEPAAKKDFIKMKNWFAMNSLSCNPNKTVFMTFLLSKISMPQINTLKYNSLSYLGTEKYDSDCFSLNRVCNVKYLGFYFDSDIKWKTQID